MPCRFQLANSRRLARRRFLRLAALPLYAALGETARTGARPLVSGGRKRTVHWVIPAALSESSRAPLVLVLHGSWQGGRKLAELWEPLANQEGFIVAGPDAGSPDAWRGAADPPDLFRDVIDTAAAQRPIDPHRVYLFGYSGGGHYALQIALAESEYFAAVAVCAGQLLRDQGRFLALAKRRIPVALFAGAKDTVVPPEDVRRTEQMLKAGGFPVEFTPMPDRDHAYTSPARLHRQVWTFFQRHQLPSAPIFVEYR